MVRFASVFALAFGFLSLSVAGFAQDEKKAKGKGGFGDPEANFKRLDENGDGKVSKEEFKKTWNARAEKMAEAGKGEMKKALSDKPDLLDKMFAAMDANKDGNISLEEYKGGLEKTRELMKDLFKKKDN